MSEIVMGIVFRGEAENPTVLGFSPNSSWKLL